MERDIPEEIFAYLLCTLESLDDRSEGGSPCRAQGSYIESRMQRLLVDVIDINVKLVSLYWK